MQIKIAPSILSADFSRLGDEIRAVEEAGAEWIHIDVMDGHYVSNITIGPVVVESIRKVTRLPLDVHLMITDPDKYGPEFIKAGADWISIHPETCEEPKTSLKKIRELGAKASIAVNPDVPLDQVERYFPDIDMVLMMTVFPGFAGQAFIEDVLPKIEKAKKVIERRKLPILIEADGGIKADNIARVVEAGAEVIVSGSGIFKTSDYADTIRRMREAGNKK
ncbi:MAG: ribulose-phosphate 3-epimerase [Deltaproteobacteria bacterium RIFCSPLOWO2_02_56_12]|nr:MAG: ribulose-phosphate 3-epimerase [Deltaproteobacteria bacterium RIFCSPLOWO2_02_56_12]OGQ66346.1 MAG: ribulose-phosphate 3-epimerase [Deltaproteobacteria bacterium RIFCSPLOWO2_12_55_13]HBA38397.1 ribulose-phosphate 3-epimerase [Deltaproteobacteria bacterium]